MSDAVITLNFFVDTEKNERATEHLLLIAIRSRIESMNTDLAACGIHIDEVSG